MLSKIRRFVSSTRDLSARLGYGSDYHFILTSGYFDLSWYLNVYEDVRNAGTDPIWHYIKHGAGEGRNPSQYFLTRW